MLQSLSNISETKTNIMKLLSKLSLAMILCLLTSTGFTQTAKPPKQAIFSDFPNKINCPASELSNAFSAVDGQHIVLYFSDNFKFSGTVISNVVKYNNLQSMSIRSDNAENTIFHLSKLINEDNTVSYVGRIINTNAADGYEIKRDVAGNYKFEKSMADKILQECNL